LGDAADRDKFDDGDQDNDDGIPYGAWVFLRTRHQIRQALAEPVV
jgi:hypothetical protein